jgi:hypothetical protein
MYQQLTACHHLSYLPLALYFYSFSRTLLALGDMDVAVTIALAGVLAKRKLQS